MSQKHQHWQCQKIKHLATQKTTLFFLTPPQLNIPSLLFFTLSFSLFLCPFLFSKPRSTTKVNKLSLFLLNSTNPLPPKTPYITTQPQPPPNTQYPATMITTKYSLPSHHDHNPSSHDRLTETHQTHSLAIVITTQTPTTVTKTHQEKTQQPKIANQPATHHHNPINKPPAKPLPSANDFISYTSYWCQ